MTAQRARPPGVAHVPDRGQLNVFNRGHPSAVSVTGRCTCSLVLLTNDGAGDSIWPAWVGKFSVSPAHACPGAGVRVGVFELAVLLAWGTTIIVGGWLAYQLIARYGRLL